nr:FAD-dependent oxidoreductase [Candidatus Sigynarchaeota archaeon]
MKNSFPLLFSPLNIGNMTIQNRIVMPAMHLSYAENGFMNERLIEFYKERAVNETGLIIIGGCYVDVLGKGVDSMIAIDDDKYIEGLSTFSRAIHDASTTKVAVQLYHSGRYSFEQIIHAKPVSSSVKYSSFSKSTPRALGTEEIPLVVEKFAAAAARAKKAGFDAVEIVGSAGYLIDQFLSPLINDRTDKYGGSFENRLRFPMETIAACKAAIGENMPLIMRYSGADLVPGSNTLKDKVAIAPHLVGAGLDALNVTGGWHESRVPSITMNVPPGTFSFFAREIKKAVTVPVFATNRINDPKIAEMILHQHRADAVCIGRGLIADPEFPVKARKGNVKQIRKCIGCNQGCFDAVFSISPVSCMRNPIAGYEAKYKLIPAEKKSKVVIIGAGVAGLECARVGAIRGHEVTVYEKEGEIGGQAWLAANPPGRNDIEEIIDWYASELERLDVKIVLNHEVTPERLTTMNPEVVVIATGARPRKPKIDGIDLPNVHFAWDFLNPAQRIYPGERCVVIGGGATGVEVALALSEFGAMEPEVAKFMHDHAILDAEEAWKITGPQRKVFIIEMLDRLGNNFGKSTRWVMLQELEMNGIESFMNAMVSKISQDGNGKLSIAFTAGNDPHRLDSIDHVFVATSIESCDALEASVKGKVKTYVVGDAKKTRDLMKAIHDGFKAGMKL